MIYRRVKRVKRAGRAKRVGLSQLSWRRRLPTNEVRQARTFSFGPFGTFGSFGSSGFTLIELVVSIGIIGILAVFVLTIVNPLQQFAKARDAQRKSDLAQIQRALEQYYQDHGKYPDNSNSYQILDPNGNPVPWGGSLGWNPYMNLVPADPDSSRTYIYYSTSNGQQYLLYASLERGPNDPEACKANDSNCQKNPTSLQYCSCTNVPSNTTCGGSTKPCNFGVSSPNTSP